MPVQSSSGQNRAWQHVTKVTHGLAADLELQNPVAQGTAARAGSPTSSQQRSVTLSFNSEAARRLIK